MRGFTRMGEKRSGVRLKKGGDLAQWDWEQEEPEIISLITQIIFLHLLLYHYHHCNASVADALLGVCKGRCKGKKCTLNEKAKTRMWRRV